MNMADGSIAGISGRNFDAFVSSQRTFNDYDLAAKIQEKYYRARQKFLAKIDKKEDTCIELSDSKLDAKLEIYHSIDKSCARLTNILESYQNCLFVFANEENSLGRLMKECSKHDQTKAGKIMAITGKSLTQSSHQRIRLYMPLLRLYQEMETFHTRAVNDTTETVDKLENKRSQYRASLLWMKDISERLDPDVYKQLDKFRRVQNRVRSDKKAFDSMQMDIVQKIDLLMASRCNLMNQILASYQATLLETFEKNCNNFRSIEEMIKREDIYEYEFKTLKQLNPLPINEPESVSQEIPTNLMQEANKDGNNDNNIYNHSENLEEKKQNDTLIDVSSDNTDEYNQGVDLLGSKNVIEELETLFGKLANDTTLSQRGETNKNDSNNSSKFIISNFNADLLNMDNEEQIANLLSPSENETQLVSPQELLNINRNDIFHNWHNVISSNSTNESQHEVTASRDSNLIGDIIEQPSKEDDKSKASIDLLTNELDDIDNGSYFKSLQRLEL